ncbi:MAG TPA: hypothetical protein VHD36_17475 [Pirellulales bacterium]|nr:hypothetical protein [Pirellulales bacterium]
MNIVFNCPGCGAILRMKEEYGGRRGRCPHCQGAITVPAIESDAGMDLLPLEGNSGESSTPQSGAAPAQTFGNFSAGSRFSMPAKSAGETRPPSSGGDSAIGLAPLEERDTKRPTTPSPTPAAPAKAKAPGGDSNLGLAPLDEHGAAKSAPAAPPAAAVAKSSAGESAIGLAPLEDVKEKPARSQASTTPKGAGAKTDEDFSLAPVEGSAAAKTGVAAAPAATKGTSAGGGPAKPAGSAAAEPPRMTCGKCGTKMRIPPNAGGRNVVCPKCKNKMRVPDIPAAAATVAKSDSETIALSDTPTAAADLGGGMLDILGEGGGLAGGEAASADDAGAALSAPKFAGGKSKSGSILGLPPLALYGGAAGVALIFALGLVYLLGGFGSGSSQVAQGPGVTAPGGMPTQPPASAPPASAPSTNPPAGSTAQTQPAAPTTAPSMPATPQTPAPSSSAPTPAPGSFQAGLAGNLRNKAQAEAAVAGGTGAQPAAPTAPAANPTQMPAGAPPTADAAAWKQRVPIVRAADAAPRAGEAASAPAGSTTQIELLTQVLNNQNSLIESLKQITDLEAARKVAPTWAEQTAKGLDSVRKLRAAGGLPNPDTVQGGLRARAVAIGAVNTDTEKATSIEGEMQRISAIGGAMPVLEAALVEQAKREPAGALATVLTERGISLQAAPQ